VLEEGGGMTTVPVTGSGHCRNKNTGYETGSLCCGNAKLGSCRRNNNRHLSLATLSERCGPKHIYTTNRTPVVTVNAKWVLGKTASNLLFCLSDHKKGIFKKIYFYFPMRILKIPQKIILYNYEAMFSRIYGRVTTKQYILCWTLFINKTYHETINLPPYTTKR
jgi:hypothetical protein